MTDFQLLRGPKMKLSRVKQMKKTVRVVKPVRAVKTMDVVPDGLFLTLDAFLAHFPVLHITRAEFPHVFKVNYAYPQTLQDLFSRVPGRSGRPLIKGLTDRRIVNQDGITDLFYRIIIEDRVAYLTGIYHAYFAFKDPCSLSWDGIDLRLDATSISVQKNDASKRLIRNLFCLELLHDTRVSNTIKSGTSFWQSLLNMFNHLELEDRFFAPSSLDLCLKEQRNLFYLFQAYQPKASIFNPYTIKWILSEVIDKVLGYQGATFFTPVLSWSAYLLAFMHSSYSTYVGVDVMPSVCEKNIFLADWYARRGTLKSTRILCQPSETLDLPEYLDYFDTIMVCPPYFNMEIYAEGPQSTSSYPDYQTWLAGYWRTTVARCYAFSKPGGVFALIINDYQDLNGRYYPLIADLERIACEFYDLKAAFDLKNRTSPLRVTVKHRTEKLLIFQKQK